MKQNLSTMLSIDSEAVKSWAKENGISLRKMGDRIGKSGGYMRYVLERGYIKKNVYSVMKQIFQLPDGAFLKREAPKGEDISDAYHVTLQIRPDKLRVEMRYGDDMIYGAWARIKGNKDLDLMQAFSYAAHLIYKQAEQNALEDHCYG